MYRYLFGVETYALVQLAALVLFCMLSVVLLRRARIGLQHAAALGVLYVVCNLLIAKVLYDYVKVGGRHTVFDHPSLAHFVEGGFWGWPIAFFPCVLIYPLVTRVRPVPFYRAVALLLPPVFAVQKVACFAAGCCCGRETALPWAVTFPAGSLCEGPGVPCHPLQLYDAVLPLGILGVLLLMDRRGGAAARPFLLPLLIGLYALARLATEFLRPRDGGGVLLVGQWFELGAAAAIIVLLTAGRGAWRAWMARGEDEGGRIMVV
jgi:phosphatidylglycerol---prolipoprotein diacylglyceryl transferase